MDEYCARAMPHIKPDLINTAEAGFTLGHDDSPVIKALGNGLLVLYAVDTGQGFEFIQNRHLSNAEISTDVLHATAINNFLGFIAERTRMQPLVSCFGLLLDGNFEASLLLVEQLWDVSLKEYAPTGYVMAVPARDILAFCDAGSTEGIQELRAIVSRVFPGGDHLISPELYRRKTGSWVRLE